MQNQTGSKFWRLASGLKWRGTPSLTAAATSSQGKQSQISQVDKDDKDRQGAQIRYKEAAKQLKKSIEIRKGSLDSFDFGDLSGEPEGFDDSQFKSKIDAILISRETSIHDRKGWSRFIYAVECVFTAFSPFAKNFLTVAKDAQSVMPFSPV